MAQRVLDELVVHRRARVLRSARVLRHVPWQAVLLAAGFFFGFGGGLFGAELVAEFVAEGHGRG